MPTAVTDTEFEKEVLQSELPVLVDFWAPWCGPCKAMLPIIDELDAEYAGKIKFVKMNVDENTEIPGQYGVMSIPTFVLMKGGKQVGGFVGAKNKEAVKKELEKVL